MHLEQLRVTLIEQERFSPHLDAVRERIQRRTPSGAALSTHRNVLRRRLAVIASVAVVAILTRVIAVVRTHPQPTRLASPPPSVVGGIRWELTSATISGMPNYGGAPNERKSLYLYPDGTSVATGFYLAREGRWRQSGIEVVFSGQHTLDHSCPIEMSSTPPRLALLHLDGPMSFSTTSMTFRAAGDAATNPGHSTATSADPTRPWH